VTWEHTAFAGRSEDNIYTNHAGQFNASPADQDDSVLAPTR
jgi:hypothetical protein